MRVRAIAVDLDLRVARESIFGRFVNVWRHMLKNGSKNVAIAQKKVPGARERGQPPAM